MVRMEFSIGMIHIVLVMLLLVKAIAGQIPIWVTAKEGCVRRCGDVSIPYPFGIGPNCYANQSYAITCNSSKPFLTSLNLEVLRINFGESRNPATLAVRNITINDQHSDEYVNLSGTPFSFSSDLIWKTDEMCYGGNITITDQHSDEYVNCFCIRISSGSPYLQNGCETGSSSCPPPGIIVERNCTSDGACHAYCNIPDIINRSRTMKFVFVGLGSGLGGLFMIMGAWWLRKIIKRRNKAKLKMKFFKRNGGLLLQKQLCSAEQVYVEKTKLFSSKELETATDHYNENRVLGRGGQGTVYKGMLTDGKIVAVKKSKIVDEGKLNEFINEVVILSQINHRNVVKLHGCCLETEVPLLVYDFIPNGTLFQYIHHQENEDFPLTWDVRLRIASEVAGALFYLHSAASLPIYHRDIKSSNILLDDKYRAKVADFGTSRSAAVEQTHMTTRVQGTFGYLDPEYYQSSQFTAKSDVYSFGVVLVELLTGQKAILPITFMEGRSLATYFMLSIKENRLFDVVDAQVLKEGREREIVGVAYLANRCLNLNGRNRPTMKEVAMELEAIKTTHAGSSHFQVQHNEEVYDYGITQLADPFDCTASTSTTSLLG